MDIYQIIMIHNRMWSMKEIAVFSVIVVISLGVVIHLIRREKIQVFQAIAIMLLIFFWGLYLALRYLPEQ